MVASLLGSSTMDAAMDVSSWIQAAGKAGVHHALSSFVEIGNGPGHTEGTPGSTYQAPDHNPLHNPSLPHAPAANIAWNAYRYIGDFLHLFGMIIMVLTLFKNQSLTGFSIKTSMIYLVLYVSRYLDLFTRHLSLYLTVFKISYISLSAVPVVLFFKWDGYGYERRKDTVNIVEEKFPQENFRVLSEMRILAKIRVVILDFVGYVEILAKFGAKLDFRV